MDKAEKVKTAAIVLAAGQGKRMKSDVPKQYMLLKSKPILYYSLKAFEESNIDEIVLIVGKGEEEECRKTYVEQYGFQKIKTITMGGKERYHSVYNGLCALSDTEYVFIHDGARPFLDKQMIQTGIDSVKEYKACVFAVPVKDTIKITDENGVVVTTPERDKVWQIQTPQIFQYDIIKGAFDRFMEKEEVFVTDDSMIVELMTNQRVHCIYGDYRNIKITTPDDMILAERFFEKKVEKN